MEQDKAKKYFWTLLDAFLALLIIGLVWSIAMAKRYGDTFANSLQPSRLLTVSAEGKTLVSPDTATLTFSVLSRGVDPEKVADESNKLMSGAIEFVKSQGIDTKDIQTTGYNLSPEYTYDDKNHRTYITGYTLTQTATVKIHDFAKIAPVVGGIAERGVNQISGVSFSVDDPEKFLSRARADAFAKAKTKAEEMAVESGAHLGRVVSVGEYQAGPIPYAMSAAKMGMGGGAETIAPPTIEPGTQELRLQVTISYALE